MPVDERPVNLLAHVADGQLIRRREIVGGGCYRLDVRVGERLADGGELRELLLILGTVRGPVAAYALDKRGQGRDAYLPIGQACVDDPPLHRSGALLDELRRGGI